MILKTSTARVIFWGCHVQSDIVTAGLSYFASNLSTKQVDLLSPDGKTIRVELPDTVLSQNMPCKLPPNQAFKRVNS